MLCLLQDCPPSTPPGAFHPMERVAKTQEARGHHRDKGDGVPVILIKQVVLSMSYNVQCGLSAPHGYKCQRLKLTAGKCKADPKLKQTVQT